MDKFAKALRKLCETHGGHVKIAHQIDANPQTVHQIISGVKLPSGNPRGVGPNLRKRLDSHYPGWSDVEMPGDVFSEVTGDEQRFLENWRRLTDQDRARYTDEIATRAKELTEYVEKFINPIKNGTVERKR